MGQLRMLLQLFCVHILAKENGGFWTGEMLMDQVPPHPGKNGEVIVVTPTGTL